MGGPSRAPHLQLIAVLDRHLTARADRPELRPERVVDLLPHRRCLGVPVAPELPRASVVGRVRGAGEIAAWLLVLLLPDGEPREVVQEDLAAGVAVVRDVAGEAVDVVEPAPGVAIH